MNAQIRTHLSAGGHKWIYEGATTYGLPIWAHATCGFVTRAGSEYGDGLPDECPMCALEERVRSLETNAITQASR